MRANLDSGRNRCRSVSAQKGLQRLLTSAWQASSRLAPDTPIHGQPRPTTEGVVASIISGSLRPSCQPLPSKRRSIQCLRRPLPPRWPYWPAETSDAGRGRDARWLPRTQPNKNCTTTINKCIVLAGSQIALALTAVDKTQSDNGLTPRLSPEQDHFGPCPPKALASTTSYQSQDGPEDHPKEGSSRPIPNYHAW